MRGGRLLTPSFLFASGYYGRLNTFSSLKFHFAKLPITGEAKPNQTMNNLEYQTELHAILELLKSVSKRADRIAESTQNPEQGTLDRLAEEANEAHHRLGELLND